jgi:RNA polymerase sigma-70 factor (ECF subfamily)
LREVLGFSAKEVAETLETSTASVNSALQRARKAVDERTPELSQQATLRSLGDDGVREVVRGYLDAWDRGDIDGVVAMLTDDACFSMPPAPSWHKGHEQLTKFLRVGPLSGDWRWHHIYVRANGQPTLAFYCWDEAAGTHLPFALNVLTIRERRISDVTAFICRATDSRDLDAYRRWPEEPMIPERFTDFFGQFGLPGRID